MPSTTLTAHAEIAQLNTDLSEVQVALDVARTTYPGDQRFQMHLDDAQSLIDHQRFQLETALSYLNHNA